MPSDLQAELLKAGLITQAQYDRQKIQEDRREAKARQKMVKATDIAGSFHSLRSFMDHIKKGLGRNPTFAHVQTLTRQAHEVADQLNLHGKRRNKMHAFLAKVAEGLASRPREERNEFLDEVFMKIDPKLVTEE